MYLIELLPPSYHCDTFGKNFQNANGSFEYTHTIKCLATESWDTTEIPLTCECKAS